MVISPRSFLVRSGVRSTAPFASRLAYPSSARRLLPVLAIPVVLLLAAGCGGDVGGEPPVHLPGDGPAAASGGPAAPAPVIPADAPVVVFLGDSIAAGLHLPADAAFPAVVQRTLAAEGVPFRLVNAGVSGDTTAGGLARVDWVLRSKPAVVVVELGANDGLRGLPLEEVEKNLRAILERCTAAGARTLLLGMRLPTSYGAAFTGGFAEMYDRVAKDTGTACVPYFMEGVAGVPDLNLPDGLHPTEEGHRRLAKPVAAALRELLH